jgi:hypothetical protein
MRERVRRGADGGGHGDVVEGAGLLCGRNNSILCDEWKGLFRFAGWAVSGLTLKPCPESRLSILAPAGQAGTELD